MKRIGLLLTAFILMVAAAAALAQLRPPRELVQFIQQYHVVYDKKCNVESHKLKNVECLIMAVDEDTIFIVLFTDDGQHITHIIYANRQEEKVLWTGTI